MSINKQPIEQANDADLRLSHAPMQRAAMRAREVAARTGTLLVVSEGGQVRRIKVEPPLCANLPVQEPAAPYETKAGLRIEGRVQGVGFREACVRRARMLGLTGYVRNRRDGSVEVVLQGSADAVARMQAWLHEGPPLARVDRVTVSSVPVAAFNAFERRPTE